MLPSMAQEHPFLNKSFICYSIIMSVCSLGKLAKENACLHSFCQSLNLIVYLHIFCTQKLLFILMVLSRLKKIRVQIIQSISHTWVKKKMRVCNRESIGLGLWFEQRLFREIIGRVIYPSGAYGSLCEMVVLFQRVISTVLLGALVQFELSPGLHRAIWEKKHQHALIFSVLF